MRVFNGIDLRCWFHNFLKMLSLVPKKRFGRPAQNLRVVRFDHWGAARGGLQLGEIERPLCDLPEPAGEPIWRVDHFHLGPHLQPILCLSRMTTRFEL